jgi:uncharacterized membrane protein YozB (DUF420 family)
MAELFHKPGFLGTNANFAADMTLILGIVVAVLFTIGLVLARMGKYDAHRWVQTTAAAINLILVLWLMVLPFRDFIVRDTIGPQPHYFYIITTLHATIGSIALLFGVFVALRGNKLVPKFLRFNNYKGFMRTSYALYMLASAIGVWVYITWFTKIPNPPVY